MIIQIRGEKAYIIPLVPHNDFIIAFSFGSYTYMYILSLKYVAIVITYKILEFETFISYTFPCSNAVNDDCILFKRLLYNFLAKTIWDF